MFALGGFDDFLGWIAEREVRRNFQTIIAKPGRGGFEITPVHFHFFGFGQFELIKISGDPAIGDVYQQQTGAKPLRQFRDVWQQAFVRATVFKGDQDFLIHGTCCVLRDQSRPAAKSFHPPQARVQVFVFNR